MKKFAYYLAAVIGMAPLAAFAQGTISTTFVNDAIDLISTIIKFAFPALTAVAVIVFIFSLIKYISGSAEDKEKNRKGLIYSLFALFIIVSLFGILRLMQTVTGTGGDNTIDNSNVPKVQLVY